MNPSDPMVKKLGDPLINTANKGQGRFERRLRGWLRVIARKKGRGIPKKLVDELTRVNSKIHFVWWIPSSANDLIAYPSEKRPPGEYEILWTSKPHLTSYWEKPFKPFELYLSALIPRLRDPAWVSALRECPGCGKLLLSNRKCENKWCSPRCRKRRVARDLRKKSNKLKGHEKEKVERIQRKCLKCDRLFLANGKYNRLCPECNEKNNRGGN